jgi:hypothetical protein
MLLNKQRITFTMFMITKYTFRIQKQRLCLYLTLECCVKLMRGRIFVNARDQIYLRPARFAWTHLLVRYWNIPSKAVTPPIWMIISKRFLCFWPFAQSSYNKPYDRCPDTSSYSLYEPPLLRCKMAPMLFHCSVPFQCKCAITFSLCANTNIILLKRKTQILLI